MERKAQEIMSKTPEFPDATFAIVEKAGAPSIVQFENSKS